MAELRVRISFVILKSLIAFGMGLSVVAMTFALLVSASPNAARSAEKVWRIGYFGGQNASIQRSLRRSRRWRGRARTR